MDSSDDEALILHTLYRRQIRKKRRKRGCWVHNINMKRHKYGEFHMLIQELKEIGNEERFFQYFRMSQHQFDELLTLLQPVIQRQKTNYRWPISAEERLCITLRYLSTGDSFRTIAFSFRLGRSTVAEIVETTCDAIWEALAHVHLKAPNEDDWHTIANRFQQRWNFPNCIGAIDGKHCVIQAPPNSGSMFYNYKGTFSVVLLALVDADYCFSVVDIGGYGRNSDGGILSQSNLGKALSNDHLGIPQKQEIAGALPDIGKLPFVIVGDEAFPLKTYLLRPYPGKKLTPQQRIYNYRHCRARRISENAFGILAARWRIYQRRMQLNAEKAVKAIKATVVLHNFLQRGPQTSNVVTTNDVTPSEVLAKGNMGGNRAASEAIDVREKFTQYFNSDAGAVAWQNDMVTHRPEI